MSLFTVQTIQKYREAVGNACMCTWFVNGQVDYNEKTN